MEKHHRLKADDGKTPSFENTRINTDLNKRVWAMGDPSQVNVKEFGCDSGKMGSETTCLRGTRKDEKRRALGGGVGEFIRP